MLDRLRSVSARALAVHAAAALFTACGGGVYPDREAATVENVRVQSARFLPLGGRFILADSATGIRFTGMHIGYACSEILNVGLAPEMTGTPPAFRPSTRVRLPTAPDCPVDTAGIDTLITRVFTGATDTLRIRLANSTGAVTDDALLIRGSLEYDSLEGVITPGYIAKGPWLFRDSSSIGPRLFYGQDLSSCRFLNHATWSRTKDTVKVRFSFVTLDPAAAADTCRGEVRLDSIPPAVYPP
jgi:hypothetical protein